MNELICKVQAILFASGDYVSFERLEQLTQADPKELKKAIKAVEEKFSSSEFAMHVQHDMNAWKFAVRKEYLPVVERLFSQTELSKSVMETLAVIAWKSPAMQADLVKIRSNKAYDHIAELIEKGFVTKEKAGRTYMLKLTQKFYNYFDVSGKEDIHNIFQSVERRAESKAILPQKKVIDFDGSPRSATQFSEREMEHLNASSAEERVKAEEEKKQQQMQEVGDIKQQHSAVLEEIEAKLTSSSQANEQLVQEFEQQKQKHEETAPQTIVEEEQEQKHEHKNEEQHLAPAVEKLAHSTQAHKEDPETKKNTNQLERDQEEKMPASRLEESLEELEKEKPDRTPH